MQRRGRAPGAFTLSLPPGTLGGGGSYDVTAVVAVAAVAAAGGSSGGGGGYPVRVRTVVTVPLRPLVAIILGPHLLLLCTVIAAHASL